MILFCASVSEISGRFSVIIFILGFEQKDGWEE